MIPSVETLEISMGETILFGLLAISMVIVAIFGLLITRRAVYTVISVIFVMVGFAFLYTMLEAPFMGVAQVVVYTGAILMMFLFVLMLIGVDSADSGHETLKAQRPVAFLGGLGMLAIMVALVFKTKWPDALGLELANAEGNPIGVAKLIFSNHVLTLELTGTLLIVAALGAMTLTHRDRVSERQTQEALAHQKMRDFVEAGVHPGQLPNPGVYAESNSSTNPSLTAYGQPLENSVNRVLKIRGQERRVAEISPETVARITQGNLPSGPSTYGAIGQARTPGMPGESAPDHDGALKRYEGIEAGTSPEMLETKPAEDQHNASGEEN
ncbi:NADH-quinone oxidoreductase subunit J [Arcanobacterium bovis]|uniref:NADH-quinone oxidoreductase subunit J n=1 Tax=Arcanobacterium bovis TaxID=2529275 RepID=A0A4V2KR88_9ACTO|nr:NADH-quinone oxidoreductase subunit J [Arcanobacterium bovis]TBW21528.1 NADH-quinone oxidoreductase subunit J [Arcanobacterium bovis]